eukprot:1160377-Pelagomonas_calceolata.AAC.9
MSSDQRWDAGMFLNPLTESLSVPESALETALTWTAWASYTCTLHWLAAITWVTWAFHTCMLRRTVALTLTAHANGHPLRACCNG